jgi:hypothetical protein
VTALVTYDVTQDPSFWLGILGLVIGTILLLVLIIRSKRRSGPKE